MEQNKGVTTRLQTPAHSSVVYSQILLKHVLFIYLVCDHHRGFNGVRGGGEEGGGGVHANRHNT